MDEEEQMAATDHHGSHGGGDHSPATDQLSPNEHRQHAERDEHGGHGTGHGGHGDHAALFRRRFWLSLVLTVPVVLYSDMWARTGLEPPTFSADHWVAPVLGTLVFLYGGPVFLKGGWDELRSRRPGMMLLISMGLLVAFGASVASQLDLIDVELWPELATLVTIMLLGHWQEMKAIGQAQGALAALAELLPDEAERITPEGVPEAVRLDDLRPGDVVLVRAGGRVPADGAISEGE